MPKRFGYGLTPCSWEGWLLTLGLVGLIFFLAWFHGLLKEVEVVDQKQLILYFLEIIGLTYLFIVFSKSRTKGEMKWRWGNKK